MIDEIPIIGVTEWTVDGLEPRSFNKSKSSFSRHFFPVSLQSSINHRRANGGDDDDGGSSRCHSNNLDSWRGGNKRVGSSNTHTRDRSSRHGNSLARNIPVPHPR